MRDRFDDDNTEKGTSDFAKMFEESLKGLDRKLSVGDRVTGEILSIGKEEVFVSTGTTEDGVVMRSDLLGDDGQFAHKVGDVLNLYVNKIKAGQTFLSPKATAKNLAEDLEDAFDMMLPVEGRVTEVCNGGFRVLLMGQTAFCPISQIDLRRVEDGAAYVGRKFEFVITQFSERGRNIVVSRRRLLEEQKEANAASFIEDHKPGDVVGGVVRRLEKYGAFIEVATGLEGLAHISEISWTRLAHAGEALALGQEVSAKILKMGEEGGRITISLSIKAAMTDPWEEASKKFSEGKVVKGVVERREPYGLFISIGDGVTGLLPKSAALEAPGFSFDKMKVGDELLVQINEVRSADRRISLSVPRDPEAEAWRGFSATTAAKPVASMGTLGEQFKGLFDTNTKKK